jgi:hypothetical protein
MIILTGVGPVQFSDDRFEVTEVEKEYPIIEWDGTEDKVRAIKLQDGSVVMTYEDGTRHIVTEKYFKSLVIDALTEEGVKVWKQILKERQIARRA